MHHPDSHYYARRAESSRDLAQRAASPHIAAIHADLASRYDLLASQPHRPTASEPMDHTT